MKEYILTLLYALIATVNSTPDPVLVTGESESPVSIAPIHSEIIHVAPNDLVINIAVKTVMRFEYDASVIYHSLELKEGDRVHISSLCQFQNRNSYNIGIGRYLQVSDALNDSFVEMLVRPHGENIMHRTEHFDVSALNAYFIAPYDGVFKFDLRAYAGSTRAGSNHYIQARNQEFQFLIVGSKRD